MTRGSAPARVPEAVGEVRRHLRRRGGLAGVLGLAAVGGAVLAGAWVAAGPAGWSAGTRLPLLLLAGGAAVSLGVEGWIAGRVRRWTQGRRVAGSIERAAGLPRGSVWAQVELSRTVPPGTSPALARAGGRALAGRIPGPAPDLAGEAGRAVDRLVRVAAGAALAALLLSLVLAVAGPERARGAWGGLAHAASLARSPDLPPLRIEPGDAALPRGEVPRVRVEAPGRDSVTVAWGGVGRLPGSRTVAVVDGSATVELEPLESEVTYHGSAPDGARTPDFRLTPVDPPMPAAGGPETVDRPPTVSLPVPAEDGELPPGRRMPLLVEAEDDRGVAWIELVVGIEGRDDAPVVERIPAGSRLRVRFEPVLDLTGWDLSSGEVVVLHARAADSAPTPQVARSAVRRLRVPEARSLREDARARTEDAFERTGRVVRETRGLVDRLRELEARAGSDDPSALAAALEEALGDRRAQMDEVRRIREELAEAAAALPRGEAEGGAGTARERLEELERLLEGALAPGDRERLAELVEGAGAGDASDFRSAVEEARREQERFREEMERVLERLRTAALDAALEGAEERLRSLAETQEAVASRLPDEEAVEDQDAAAGRGRALRERLREIGAALERDGESAEAARGRLEAAGEELARSVEAMEQAAGAARRADADRARERGSAAATSAGRALESVEEARREWNEARAAALRDGLRRVANDALGVARRQAELRERMRASDPLARRELQGEMATLAAALRNLAIGAGVAAREDPGLGRALSRAIAAAMSGVRSTIEGLEEGERARPAAWVRAGEAQDAANEVARIALEALWTPPEEGPDGDAERLMDDLESLASRQGELNEEAASLSAGGDDDARPGRMEELAAGQGAVAGAVEELARRPGSDRLPGDLEELAREAQELARELEQGRLAPETLARQERLLERLLAAGRTLEGEGEALTREGRAAGPVERRAIAPLSPELLLVPDLPRPSPAELEALTPMERRLVLEYLERLDRRRAGGGRP